MRTRSIACAASALVVASILFFAGAADGAEIRVMISGGFSAAYLDLVRRGFKVLVATPYGPEWYPYLMRRLAERPANLGFFAKNLVRR